MSDNPLPQSTATDQSSSTQISNQLDTSQSFVEPHNTESPPSPKKNRALLVVLLISVTTLLAGGFWWYSQSPSSSTTTNQNTSQDNPTVSQPDLTTPTPTQLQPSNSQTELVFIRDDELWTLDKSGAEKQTTFSNQTIFTYDVSADNSVVAYITGKKITNQNNYTYVEPDTAFLYNTNTDQNIQIYSLAPKKTSFLEYIIALKDVGVSSNGSKVAITTSDSLLIYDVETEQLTTIISTPIVTSPNTMPQVFAYLDPIFSPDNTKIVYKLGYYEGVTFGWVDTLTNKVGELPFVSYMSGQTVLGWFDNNSLLISDYEGVHTATKAYSTIAKSPLTDPQKLVNIASQDGVIQSSDIANQQLYSVVNTTEEVTSPAFPDINFSLNFYHIKNTTLISGEQITLSTVQTDYLQEANKVSKHYSSVRLSPEGTKLFTNLSSGLTNLNQAPTYSNSIVMFDLVENPNGGEPQVVVKNARL